MTKIRLRHYLYDQIVVDKFDCVIVTAGRIVARLGERRLHIY